MQGLCSILGKYIVTVNVIVALQFTNDSLNDIYDTINVIGEYLIAILRDITSN